MSDDIDLTNLTVGDVVWQDGEWEAKASPEDVINESLAFKPLEIGETIVMRSRQFLGTGVMRLERDLDDKVTHRLDVAVPDGCDFIEDCESELDAADILSGLVPATIEPLIKEIADSDDWEALDVPLSFWRLGPVTAYRVTMTEVPVPAVESEAETNTAAEEAVSA